MPKIIDQYVLEARIGKGQFGEVYRGVHQKTGQIVAVKAIQRGMIKGKLYELLENEIKVLRTCDNPYIVKLIEFKKTPNNYYLMLEYCDQGDMLVKVRKEGRIDELQVIKYFRQIMAGFQTLLKNHIMHRDFKLANILIHQNSIKIADFGFAKLLDPQDFATTMLGSPLNMAPEVLGGNKYNSKADIWSIGACIYQMLYGKPPYVAGNTVDLLQLIKNQPLSFPASVPVNDVLVDVIRKMLVADVRNRISWQDLFNHPINTYLATLKKKEIDLSLVDDESKMLNTSKYYLKANLVASRPQDLKYNQDVNHYLVDIIRTGGRTGTAKEHTEQTKKVKDNSNVINKDSNNEDGNRLDQGKQETGTAAKLPANFDRICRYNTRRLLHYRNIYTFLAAVNDDIIQNHESPLYDIAAYVLARKILDMIVWLQQIIICEICPLKGLTHWELYRKEQQFAEVKTYVDNEYQVFKVYSASLEPVIKQKCLQGEYGHDVRELVAGKFKESTYFKYLWAFVSPQVKDVVVATLACKDFKRYKPLWKNLLFSLISLRPLEFFGVGEEEFDFKTIYTFPDTGTNQAVLQKIEGLLVTVC